MEPIAFALIALVVLGVWQQRRLREWMRRVLAKSPPEPEGAAPPAGPYREPGEKPEEAADEDAEPSPFDAPPADALYRRDKIVYVAIAVGGPIALLNGLIVPFVTPVPVLLSALTLALAIPCANVVGARINRRKPEIPDAVATWSVLHHGMVLLTADGGAEAWAILAACALAHAALTVVAARAQPIRIY